ncbi:MAG: 30S ribosomal protein S27ae [Candidatus Diapherotrites archaeon]|uniref:Small ribosomal subunit protein eS31 n=1 Tax=Candidatus Iainarchaeum sp. TaxID=3101447 RepID=A0A2D6M0K0_9ARCH|nr:30S ribosomal protein S27ae [Candidatus Diapherotrites archaeon]
MKDKERKGKRERKKHEIKKKGDYYKSEGDKASREKRFCPKCGAGVFMAEHADRFHCGKCSYTEWKDK